MLMRGGPVFWFSKVHTRTIGQSIREFDAVDSTNRVALEMAAEGAVEGTVVVAGEQLAGRGQFGRTWHSPGGTGLYFSFIIHPDSPSVQAGMISLGSALALQHVLHRYYSLDAAIKWPNDVLIRDAKIAGILVESVFSGSSTKTMVAGIGVNLSQIEAGEDYRREPTSIEAETGAVPDSHTLLEQLLNAIDSMYAGLRRGHWPRLIRQLNSVLYGKNAAVQIKPDSGPGISGNIHSVAEDGGLNILDNSGKIRTIYSGEIVFC